MHQSIASLFGLFVPVMDSLHSHGGRDDIHGNEDGTYPGSREKHGYHDCLSPGGERISEDGGDVNEISTDRKEHAAEFADATGDKRQSPSIQQFSDAATKNDGEGRDPGVLDQSDSQDMELNSIYENVGELDDASCPKGDVQTVNQDTDLSSDKEEEGTGLSSKSVNEQVLADGGEAQNESPLKSMGEGSDMPENVGPHHEDREMSSDSHPSVNLDNADAQTSSAQSSLRNEKERVQNLIYQLVDRVCEDSKSRDTSVSTSSQKESVDPETSSAAPSEIAHHTTEVSPEMSTGVPYGDARAYCARPPQANDDSDENPVRDMFWIQSMDCTTLTVVLGIEPPPTARDVHVEFTSMSVTVQVYDRIVLTQSLHHPINSDDSLWSLDTSSKHGQSLILEMEKAKLMWWPVLFTSHDPSTYKPHDQVCAAAARGSTPPQTGKARENNSESGVDEQKSVSTALASSDKAAEGSGNAIDRSVDAGGTIDDGKDSKNAESHVDFDATQSESADAGSTLKDDESESVDDGQTLGKSQLDRIIAQYRKIYEADETGSGEAALQLATFYHHGIGLEHSNAEAAKLYKFALEHGVLDSTAAFQLGLIFNQGCEGISADPQEAVRWWIVSAKLGNAVAMYNLGVMYMNGSGCDMEPRLAMQLFRQAQSLNPQLRPPELTPAQYNDRVAKAAKLKKLRHKAELSDEDRRRRREQGMEIVRYAVYGTVAVATISITAVLVRNWWRNRL